MWGRGVLTHVYKDGSLTPALVGRALTPTACAACVELRYTCLALPSPTAWTAGGEGGEGNILGALPICTSPEYTGGVVGATISKATLP